MFDFEQLMKGFTKEDEFIARDVLILELLCEKGIISDEEIEKKFKTLPDKIKNVHETREKAIKDEYEKILGGWKL